MLTEDLKSLKARLQSYSQTGVSITPAAVSGICSILGAAIRDAKNLEAHAVKHPCIRVFPQSKNADDVVDFADEKARRDIETWITGQGVRVITTDPDGGDAA